MTPTRSDSGARPAHTPWRHRAPIPLYRAGFGVLFGIRTLMLRHAGAPGDAGRYAMFRIVHRPQPDRLILTPAPGGDPNRLRELESASNVHVWIGHHRELPATATSMTAEEAATALESCADPRNEEQAQVRALREAAEHGSAGSQPLILLEFDGPGFLQSRTS
ncbi:hypothetical protein [Nocardia huaxiensis]|uniref:hypothetical protein n=1 Tax=Nocardia huaxiensis TaxID=2755382 RepID=UPI001E55E28B|nr:hypothetical protein [Nocardia huaxiensis]UFS97073.1 hypothetical protein LPY97_03825 [Nocardia huaxiensis]